MTLRLYGTAKSRASRSILALEELGLAYEHVALGKELRDPVASLLWPNDARSRGRICQWSFWAQTEMDRKDWESVRRSSDAEAIERMTRAKIATLAVLDGALGSSPYLVGDSFTFADLNVASTLSQPNEQGRIDWQRLDPTEIGLPRLADWLSRCTQRESWRRVASYD